MKIAILGWGSLVWDPRDLPLASAWSPGGPELPIEFSRISANGRLTLVIDLVNGVGCATYFATSARDELAEAVEDLRLREGPIRRENIGVVSARERAVEDTREVTGRIARWICAAGFEAAVWTALGSNFQEKQNAPFSVTAAMNYLTQLSGEPRRAAFEYLERAPNEVGTPLRRAFAARTES